MESKESKCDPVDISLKSLFLGPQSENADWFSDRVTQLLQHYFQWRKKLFPNDGNAISSGDMQEPEYIALRQRMTDALDELMRNTECETPKFTPRYIGHMVSEVTLPALLGEFALLLHNPNNCSPEVAKYGRILELEGIEALARMIGFDPMTARGHFTSGGTLANFEALWRARHRLDQQMAFALSQIKNGLRDRSNFFEICHQPPTASDTSSGPNASDENSWKNYSLLSQGPWGIDVAAILGREFLGPIVLVPGNKHYSWPKACALMGLGEKSLWPIALDNEGRLDITDLEEKIQLARQQFRPIVAIVSVAGTTELGEFDPVDAVQDRMDRYLHENGLLFWHHVDAAYGGYLACLKDPADARQAKMLSTNVVRALNALKRVDSITIDPHKLGYVPYACGAVLTRTEHHYKTFRVSAPYLTDRGESINWATTLEGSRSAAGAAAVWLTSKTLPFDANGFGHILEKSLAAQKKFAEVISKRVPLAKIVTPVDSNVLCFAVAKAGESIDSANDRIGWLFDQIEAGPDFSVSRTSLSRSSYKKMIARLADQWGMVDDGASDLKVLRLVLMNPFIVAKEMKIDFAERFADVLNRLIDQHQE